MSVRHPVGKKIARLVIQARSEDISMLNSRRRNRFLRVSMFAGRYWRATVLVGMRVAERFSGDS